MNRNAIIAIPVYKNSLNQFEQISLIQGSAIFDKYTITYIAPESLNVDYGIGNIKIEKFSNEYFKNTATYSELLLSPSFYQRFEKYEYMLIYQLDAFVFSDRLEEFCDLGYDYIGAPINEGGWKKYHVGNGGLSLRKISSVLNLLEHKEEIMRDNPLKEEFCKGEDNFFAYCGAHPDIDFTVPSVFRAAEFSAQNDVGHGLRDIPKRGLPFGTHHWYTMNYNVWKPIIEGFGYTLPDMAEVEYRDFLKEDQQRRMNNYVFHYLRNHGDEVKPLQEELHLTDNNKYIIWGAGKYGKKCLKLLKRLKLEVDCFFDENADSLSEYQGISIVYPVKSALEGKQVIVAVKNESAIKEIEGRLQSMGMKHGYDYTIYVSIYDEIKKHIKSEVISMPGITCPIKVSGSV